MPFRKSFRILRVVKYFKNHFTKKILDAELWNKSGGKNATTELFLQGRAEIIVRETSSGNLVFTFLSITCNVHKPLLAWDNLIMLEQQINNTKTYEGMECRGYVVVSAGSYLAVPGFDSRPLSCLLGRAIAQAVSRWLPTAAARVQTRI
jgi:hypothetical protein